MNFPPNAPPPGGYGGPPPGGYGAPRAGGGGAGGFGSPTPYGVGPPAGFGGPIGGPLMGSFFMQFFGPKALFGFIASVYALYIVIILYRMAARPAVPEGHRSRFVALLRTSPLFARLARRSGVDRPQRADPVD